MRVGELYCEGRAEPPAHTQVRFSSPGSGLPTSASESALSRVRSFSHGSQQDSPRVRASPSFPGAAVDAPGPQKGDTQPLAPLRGKAGWWLLAHVLQCLPSCCAEPQP